jgi:hypothetical protein
MLTPRLVHVLYSGEDRSPLRFIRWDRVEVSCSSNGYDAMITLKRSLTGTDALAVALLVWTASAADAEQRKPEREDRRPNIAQPVL